MCRTGIDDCIGKHPLSAASFAIKRWRESEGGPACPPRMWGREQVQSSLGGWPASHSPESFSFPTEHVVSACLFISQAGDFGSLQLYLVELSPHLPHPLRISLWATLITAQAVLALGAMPVHSKQWLLSPVSRLYTTPLQLSVGRISQSCPL